MPVTTYLNGERLNAMLHLEDQEMDKLYQEVRAIDPRLYIHESTIQEKRFLRPHTLTRFFQVFIVLDKNFNHKVQTPLELSGIFEVQMVLADDEGLKFQSTRTEIMKYLYGVLHGYGLGKGANAGARKA